MRRWPIGDFLCEADDQVADVRSDLWTARPVRVGPLPCEDLAVPGQQRGRGDDAVFAQLGREQPGQRGQDRTVCPRWPWPADLTTQHRNLVAQHQDLDGECAPATRGGEPAGLQSAERSDDRRPPPRRTGHSGTRRVLPSQTDPSVSARAVEAAHATGLRRRRPAPTARHRHRSYASDEFCRVGDPSDVADRHEPVGAATAAAQATATFPRDSGGRPGGQCGWSHSVDIRVPARAVMIGGRHRDRACTGHTGAAAVPVPPTRRCPTEPETAPCRVPRRARVPTRTG
jgi:hypothetical protein